MPPAVFDLVQCLHCIFQCSHGFLKKGLRLSLSQARAIRLSPHLSGVVNLSFALCLSGHVTADATQMFYLVFLTYT